MNRTPVTPQEMLEYEREAGKLRAAAGEQALVERAWLEGKGRNVGEVIKYIRSIAG